MNKFFNAFKIAGMAVAKYLSDWRNWLTHGLIGVALVLAAIFVPVSWWIKVLFFIAVHNFFSVK